MRSRLLAIVLVWLPSLLPESSTSSSSHQRSEARQRGKFSASLRHSTTPATRGLGLIGAGEAIERGASAVSGAPLCWPESAG